MALPVYPPNVPTSPLIKMAERGQQNYFFTNAQSIISTAAGGRCEPTAPTHRRSHRAGCDCHSKLFLYRAFCLRDSGLKSARSVRARLHGGRGCFHIPHTGASAARTVAVLGSLDGASFLKWHLWQWQVREQFSRLRLLPEHEKIKTDATPGIKVRFLTAAIVAYGWVRSEHTDDSVTEQLSSSKKISEVWR